MLKAERVRAQTHTQNELNEYSCLHKLCFTSANSRQTFSQNAHEATQHPLPLHTPYRSTWQCVVSSPHSYHQPCSLNITICLIVPSKFPFPHPLPPSPLHYFCSTTPPSPLSLASWGYWPTWQALMISPVFFGPSVPEWPRCLLIILSSAQPEALSTSNLLPFQQTNHSHATSCMF